MAGSARPAFCPPASPFACGPASRSVRLGGAAPTIPGCCRSLGLSCVQVISFPSPSMLRNGAKDAAATATPASVHENALAVAPYGQRKEGAV